METKIKSGHKTTIANLKSAETNKEYSEFSFLIDYNSKELHSPEFIVTPKTQIVNRITTNGKIKFCNEDFSKTTGFNKKDILNINQIVHPTMPKTIFNHVIKKLDKNEEVIALVKHIDKKGNQFWLNTLFSPNNSSNLTIAYSTKATATTKKTIDKISKIYNTVFLLEKHVNPNLAKKYFDGLIEMEYGTYEGFIIDAFE